MFVSCHSLYRRKYKQGECRVFMGSNAVTVYVLAGVLSVVPALRACVASVSVEDCKSQCVQEGTLPLCL